MKYYEDRYESSTQKIKNMAKEILKKKKGEPVYLKDIRNSITLQLGREFSSGVYSSAMRDLIEEEKDRIVNVDRGVYMYVSSIKKYEINNVLDNCIKSLKGTAYVDLLNVEDEDIKYIGYINNMIDVIENLKFK